MARSLTEVDLSSGEISDARVSAAPFASASDTGIRRRILSLTTPAAEKHGKQRMRRTFSDDTLHKKTTDVCSSDTVSGKPENTQMVGYGWQKHSCLGEAVTEVAKHPANSSTPALSVKDWKGYILEWFPELFAQIYFLPPVHTNRTNKQSQTVTGVKVADPVSTIITTGQKGEKNQLFDSEVRDDQAQQHVLHCLGVFLTQLGEVMFILSQFNYKSYLNEMCSSITLPRPADLKRDNLDRGDFDILIIHKKYGFIVGEIKSFGASSTEMDGETFKKTLVNRLKKAIAQLKKAKKVLDHLNKDKKEKLRVQATLMLPHVHSSQLDHLNNDRKEKPRVQATLMLPYVHSSQLKNVLTLGENASVRKDLSAVLDVPDGEDPVDYCLCADQFSHPNSPWDVTSDVLNRLEDWWQRCVRRYGPDPAMDDDAYLDIVARFAGPASVVQVYSGTKSFVQTRTLGQAVEAVHKQLTDFALYPAQVDILHQALDCVFLTGPPGTGKTLMLVLTAVSWLRPTENKKCQCVQIVSTRKKSRAASHLIHDQIIETADRVIGKGVSERVCLYFMDTKNGLTEAEKTLQAAAEKDDGHLNIIADEVDLESLHAFFAALNENPSVKKLRFWAANMKKTVVPEGVQEFVLQYPLRSPPCVVREVGKADSIKKDLVYPFSRVPVSASESGDDKNATEKEEHVSDSDGPPVIWLKHVNGEDGHSGMFTVNCRECGVRLAKVLKNKLQIGKEIRTGETTYTPIRYKDVIVLTHFDPATDPNAHDGQILRGLLDKGIPVRVVLENDDVGIAEVASLSGEDAVTMTGVNNVLGLERSVVVWVGAHETGDAYGARLTALSRCAGQLIWIYR